MTKSIFGRVEVVKAYEDGYTPGAHRSYCARLVLREDRGLFPIYSSQIDQLAPKVKQLVGTLPMDIPVDTIKETEEMKMRNYRGDLPVGDTEKMLFAFHVTRDIKTSRPSLEDTIRIKVGAAALA